MDYELDMPHKKKRLRVVHVNMLRQYHQAGSTNGLVEMQDMDPHQDDNFGLDEAIPSLVKKEESSAHKVTLGLDLHDEKQMMNQLLVGKEQFALAYLDDLVIFSRTWRNIFNICEQYCYC